MLERSKMGPKDCCLMRRIIISCSMIVCIGKPRTRVRGSAEVHRRNNLQNRKRRVWFWFQNPHSPWQTPRIKTHLTFTRVATIFGNFKMSKRIIIRKFSSEPLRGLKQPTHSRVQTIQPAHRKISKWMEPSKSIRRTLMIYTSNLKSWISKSNWGTIKTT